jgi:hypothetical protein
MRQRQSSKRPYIDWAIAIKFAIRRFGEFAKLAALKQLQILGQSGALRILQLCQSTECALQIAAAAYRRMDTVRKKRGTDEDYQSGRYGGV